MVVSCSIYVEYIVCKIRRCQSIDSVHLFRNATIMYIHSLLVRDVKIEGGAGAEIAVKMNIGTRWIENIIVRIARANRSIWHTWTDWARCLRINIRDTR